MVMILSISVILLQTFCERQGGKSKIEMVFLQERDYWNKSCLIAIWQGQYCQIEMTRNFKAELFHKGKTINTRYNM